MATVYSLICWGGRTGKTVSISAATDVVTLTNHGLRNGTKLWPSGTLPSELNTSTPVYARSTAANTFTLHTSSAGAVANTGQITFAGSSTYAAVVLKSDLVANAASALAPYGLSDLSRWGSSGSEFIYDGLLSWYNARLTPSSGLVPEVCEIGEEFTDTCGTYLDLQLKSPSTVIESRINGVRTPAFHNGVVNPVSGYVLFGSAGNGGIRLSQGNASIDGFTVDSNYGGLTGCYLVGFGTSATKIILKNVANRGFFCFGPGSRASMCLAKNCSSGFFVTSFTFGLKIDNSIATGCTKGFDNDGATSYASVYNNISVGNTTNWITSSLSTNLLYSNASNNAGLTGEAWITTGGTRLTIATTDFLDYSNSDYRPASISSPQVDTGVAFYGVSSTDIGDDEVPNYNNGGAEYFDVGPYEFDHGYGPHPASHELTLTNVVVGSRVAIRDQADTVTHYDDVAASSTVVVAVTVYGDLRDNWRVKVRKASAAPFYQPYETLMTATPGSSSIYVSQIPDE